MSEIRPNPTRAIRRVVTGHDSAGHSCVIEDGAASSVRTLAIRPGFQAVNLWHTSAAPSPIDEPDSIAAHVGISPPAGGTVLRIIDIPPEPKDPAALKAMIQGTFGSHFKDADRHAEEPKHPGMHRTSTIDYALILEGEVVAVLDNDETLLKAGDVLIQRGTNHSWANRSDRVCRIAFILIDARPAER